MSKDQQPHELLKELGATFVRLSNSSHEMWRLPNGKKVILSTKFLNRRTIRNQLTDIKKAAQST